MTIQAGLNAARAFALASLADGRLSDIEQDRFITFAALDPMLRLDEAQVREVWNQAVIETERAQSFGGPLLAIRSTAKTPDDKAVVMRAAQAAIVADGRLQLQESAALRALADALGLDPDTY